MGREIRMVPANWQHPKKHEPNYLKGRMEERYQPMFDRSYTEAMDEWIADYQLWKDGKHPAQMNGDAKGLVRYGEWSGNPPDHEYYRPEWSAEQMTHFQVYETVSEGTPVSPVFATKEDLVEYLVAHGDYWDQQRRAEGNSTMACEPWSRKAAESFVFGTGWAPTAIVTGGKIMSGVEGLADVSKHP